MKAGSVLLLAATAALSSAQVTFDNNGTFTCALPDASYCAGGSLKSNIIIRCVNGTGYAGNCDDNLAGYPPLGVSYSPCYQTSAISGNAACSKNGIVYPGSESTINNTTPYPVPNYNPSTYNASATSSTHGNGTTRITMTRTNTYSTTITSIITTDCGNGTMIGWNTTRPTATDNAKIVYTTTTCTNGTMAQAAQTSVNVQTARVYITTSAWSNTTVPCSQSTMATVASPSAAAAADSAESTWTASPKTASSSAGPIYASGSNKTAVGTAASSGASWSTGTPVPYTGAASQGGMSAVLAVLGAVAALIAL